MLGHLVENGYVVARLLRADTVMNFLTSRGHEDVGGPAVDAITRGELRIAPGMDFDSNVVLGNGLGNFGAVKDVLFQPQAGLAVVVVEMQKYEAPLLGRHAGSGGEIGDPGDLVLGGGGKRQNDGQQAAPTSERLHFGT